MTDTRRSQQIEAIAALIDQGYDPRYDESRAAYAKTINDGEGWTVDIGYGHEDPGNWTRTEGIVLTDDELGQAVAKSEALS